MSGIQAALLSSPPGEQMRSRLSVLRSAPLEARAALVEVLLAEAPDAEALVLLLLAAADSRIWERRLRPGLPAHRQTFCRALIERFGARAADGLLALEARYPHGQAGWLHALAELARDGRIPDIAYPGLIAAAARCCADPDAGAEYEALTILSLVDAPPALPALPELPALIDRLWYMAREPAQLSHRSDAAARALARLPALDGHLDAAVQAEMEDALAVRDLPRFARAAAVGVGRGLPAAIALTERVLAEIGPTRAQDPRVVTALADCVEALAAAGRLSEDFVSEGLGRSGTYLCAVAARHARRCQFLGPDADALAGLLASDDPVCAAEAACALLGHCLIDAGHAGLLAIAARAPVVLRADMVSFLRFRGASWTSLWPLLAPLLVSADPDVTAPILYLAHEFDREDLPEKLRPLLPRVVDPELRNVLVDIFASEGNGYWKDHADE
jgi:hypothetical protein